MQMRNPLIKIKLSKVCCLVLLAPLLFATQAFGATIIWGTPTDVNVNDASQVSTAGILFAAESIYGNQTSTPITVNNVTFTDTSAIAIDYFGYQAYGSTTSGINYQTLLAGGEYLQNGQSAGGLGIHLSGLSSGQDYQIQLWTTYWVGQYPTHFSNNTPNPVTDAHATPESGLLMQGFGGASPQYILGTFTAGGTTQDVYFYGSNGYGLFGALQVRAVPEPQTWALAALGLFAVFFRRKSRQRDLVA